jgi:protein TonB
MSILNNQQKMLDIIFAKRNKSYGAYAIRSAYGSTIFRSLFIVFVTVASSAGLAYWLKENPATKINDIVLEQDTTVRVIVCKMDPPKAPEQPQPKNDGGSTTSTETATLINEHTNDSTKQIVNTDPQPTNTTTAGGTGSGTQSLTGTGNSTTTSGGGDDGKPKDLFGVDENPEFEGGHNALLAFVKKHLVYPNTAAEIGKQGTLYVKFVVDEAGKVTNILLQNNLGYGLDDEAMRVVKMIPKFKSPGKVKGQPVKTYYQIPIKFKLG